MLTRILTLTLTLASCACGSSDSPKPQPPRVVPVTLSCLKQPPPARPPSPTCSLESQPCADEYMSAIIDWAIGLEKWGRVAWASCQVTP